MARCCSFAAIARTPQPPLGFDETGILTARITLPEFRYDASAKRIAFFDQLETRIRNLPTVTTVGSAAGIPFSGWDIQSELNVFGRPPARANQELITHYQLVFPDFFKAMGVPIVRGRMLNESDRDSLAPTGVINETFAKDAFPGEDPIGKRVKTGEPGQPRSVDHDRRGHSRLSALQTPAADGTSAVHALRDGRGAVANAGHSNDRGRSL